MGYRDAVTVLREARKKADADNRFMSFDLKFVAAGMKAQWTKGNDSIRFGNITIPRQEMKIKENNPHNNPQIKPKLKINDEIIPRLVQEIGKWRSPFIDTGKDGFQILDSRLDPLDRDLAKSLCKTFSRTLHDCQKNKQTVCIDCGDGTTIELRPREVNGLPPHSGSNFHRGRDFNHDSAGCDDTYQYFTLPQDTAEQLVQWIARDPEAHARKLMTKENITVIGAPATKPAPVASTHVQRTGRGIEIAGEQMQEYISALQSQGWDVAHNEVALLVQKGREKAPMAIVKDGCVSVSDLQKIANKTQIPLPDGVNAGRSR